MFLDNDESKVNLYPIPEAGGIYSKNVLILRDNEKTGYAFLPQPFHLSFIAQAAKHDPVLEDGKLSAADATDLERKIRSILKIGYNHDHDSIVLGALGCGAFKNPPIDVAKIFHKVVKEFLPYYEYIVFAIIDDRNSMNNSKEGNLKSFKRILEN